jgi:hypothetical protein
MPRIPKTKEWPTKYKTPFVTIMEPWKAVTNKVMRRSSVRTRLPIKAEPPKVEPKGWGDNVFMVTPTYL